MIVIPISGFEKIANVVANHSVIDTRVETHIQEGCCLLIVAIQVVGQCTSVYWCLNCVQVAGQE